MIFLGAIVLLVVLITQKLPAWKSWVYAIIIYTVGYLCYGCYKVIGNWSMIEKQGYDLTTFYNWSLNYLTYLLILTLYFWLIIVAIKYIREWY